MNAEFKRLERLISAHTGSSLIQANALRLLVAVAVLGRWVALAWLLTGIWQQQIFVWWAACLILLALSIELLASYYQRRAAHSCGWYCAQALQQRLLQSITAAPVVATRQHSSGGLTNASVDLCRQISEYVEQFSAQSWYLRLWPFVIVALVWALAPQLGWWLLAALLVTVALLALIGLLSQRAGMRQLEQLETVSSYFVNTIANLAIVKLWRQIDRQQARMAADARSLATRTMAVLKYAFLSSALLEWMTFALLALASWLLLLRSDWGVVELLAFFLVLECFSPLRELGQGFHIRAYAASALGQIDAMIEAIKVPAAATAGRRLSLERAPALRVERLQLPALDTKPCSFELAAGSRLLLRGPSGCGKSSLLQILAGIDPAPPGRIWINSEVDLSQLDLASWRQQCAYLSQHPVLLPMSIKANLQLGQSTNVDLEAITRDLHIDEFAPAPQQHTARLGNDNIQLSGGQLARVALARCLLKDSKLLLLDEPLQGIESWRLQQLLPALLPYLQGKTVIICSHLTLFENLCDQVLDMAAE